VTVYILKITFLLKEIPASKTFKSMP